MVNANNINTVCYFPANQIWPLGINKRSGETDHVCEDDEKNAQTK